MTGEKVKHVFVITRGVQHAGKLAGLLPNNIAQVYVWPQKDAPKEDGTIPSEIWLKAVLAIIGKEGRAAHVIRLPDEFGDHNDLLKGRLADDPDYVKNGSSLVELKNLIACAQVVEPPPPQTPPTQAAGADDTPSQIVAKKRRVQATCVSR
jgi:hypothetical protein